jgi:hypothetical protein
VSSSSKRDLVIVACAVSAGVHAALAPAHFQESFAEGAGFVAATVLLAAMVAALAFFPASRLVSIAVAFVFAGLLVSYVFAATTGIPLLHPDVEPVDGLAVDTTSVELFGLALAVDLGRRRVSGRVPLPAIALTVMVAVFSALVALALSTGHHHA